MCIMYIYIHIYVYNNEHIPSTQVYIYTYISVPSPLLRRRRNNTLVLPSKLHHYSQPGKSRASLTLMPYNICIIFLSLYTDTHAYTLTQQLFRARVRRDLIYNKRKSFGPLKSVAAVRRGPREGGGQATVALVCHKLVEYVVIFLRGYAR